MLSNLADWQTAILIAVLIGIALDAHDERRRVGVPLWLIYVLPFIRTLALTGAILLAVEVSW